MATRNPIDSAGDVVAEQQQARDDGADTQNPGQPATVLTLDGRILPAGQAQTQEATQTAGTTVVNGQAVSTNTEAGTDGPLVPITQSQATPPYNPNAGLGTLGSGTFGILNSNGSQAATPGLDQFYTSGQPVGQRPGAGSGTGISNLARQSDDNIGATNTTTKQVLTQTFTGVIAAQPNQLDQYSSYTYAISWYLLTPAQYNNLVDSQKKDTSNWQLLMQSGGAAPTSTVYYENSGQASATTGGRSQYFPFDYYMDDLEILSLIPLGGTNMSNSATDLKFKVTEPNGITLINNLYQAVTSVYKQDNPSSTTNPVSNTTANTTAQNPNYPMAQYCLVVHFYGYDSDGNLVAPATGNYIDQTSIIEKYYPFVITNIKFRMANKQIEYEVAGKPIPHFYNFGTDRGTIPFNFNLAGQTVGQLLIGTPVNTQAPADPGARTTKATPPSAGGGRGFVNPPLVGSVSTPPYIDSVTGSESGTGIDFNYF